MQYASFSAGGRELVGVVSGSTIKRLDAADMRSLIATGFGASETGETFELGEVLLLPPANPTKIVCIGLNYRDHAEELRSKGLLEKLPEKPVLFLKPPSALIGSGADIKWPEDGDVKQVDYEAELAVIIGKRAKEVSESKALECIAGYSCFNDVTARNVQREDVQWTRAKGYDTFAPCGPFLVTDVDAATLRIGARLNGKVVQQSSTGNMLFSVPALVSFVSRVMTLLPGDIIATGTPAGIGGMRRGDVIEVEIEGVGTLRNTLR